MSRLNYLETEALLYFLADHEETEDSDFDDVCDEKYDCDFEVFNKIIADVFPTILVAKSALSEKLYYGFADKKNGSWIVKREVSDE